MTQRSNRAFTITVFAIFVSLSIFGDLRAQATQHHFFIHGWSQSNTSMQPLADDMKSSTYLGWGESPTLPYYASLTNSRGIASEVSGAGVSVHSQLHSDHMFGNYVGLGYSAGGLHARYEAQSAGSTFIQGIVTLHTPNAGIPLASVGMRNWLIVALMAANSKGSVDLNVFITPAMLTANTFGSSTFDGLVQDMIPGCSFLNTINGTQPNIPRVAVWGRVADQQWASFQDAVNGPTNWLNQQGLYRRTGAMWNQSAQANQSQYRWYKPWTYGHKAEAMLDWMVSDMWNNKASAMDDIESAWETAIGSKGQSSDGFISVSSQKAIPNATSIIQDNVAGRYINHGEAILDIVFSGAHVERLAIYHALQTAGAQ